MFKFHDPWFLLLLLIISFIIYDYKKGSRSGRIQYSSIERFKRLRIPRTVRFRYILVLLRIAGIMLIIVSLARPQSGNKFTEVTSEGIDIMLVLDTSGSMQAMDFEINGERVNRLEIAKRVVREFINKRVNDRIGMVVFAEHAFTQCPLTLDYNILLSFLQNVKIGVAGDGTAIGSALGIAVQRIKNIKSKSKVIILLTDGRNNFGSLFPQTAAEIARTYGIKVYTIGVGTHGEVPFLVDTFFGKRYIYQSVDIDEETLQDIAKITGGQYFKAVDSEALIKIYRQIDAMEKTKVEIKTFYEYNELFYYFLVIGIIAILMEMIFSNTWLRKIP